MEHSQGQADHLQVLGPRRRRDVARLGPHIVDDGLLQPGDQEMRALVDNLVLHTGQSVEDDSPGAALHVVHGLAEEEDTTPDRDGPFVDVVESIRRHPGQGWSRGRRWVAGCVSPPLTFLDAGGELRHGSLFLLSVPIGLSAGCRAKRS